ncbi:DapH/DapD/GlmU-related protein [Desulfobacterales bacterium HSG17]|nr:DapH/DapD/GlmU-related protein [Desulfobacterales bacterium HSG17]
MNRTFYSFLKNIYFNFLKRKSDYYMQSLVDNGLKIGANVGIMDGCFLDPSHCYLISIGDNCTLAPNVRLIAHDASMKRLTGYARVGLIEIGDNCFIGDSVIVLPGVIIGENSIIGTGAVVTHDIPAGSVAVGNPCKRIASTEKYFVKHKNGIKKYKAPFSEKHQTLLSDENKAEIVLFLKNKKGYIR